METVLYLDEVCRLCLDNKGKDASTLLVKITPEVKEKFENLTQKKLVLTEDLPANYCFNCEDNLNNFYFYK
jgi:hypothetical protein